MYRLIAASSLLVGLAQALTVNTPAALVQCQPALLSWSDGTAPYYLAVIPGGQPSAAALENLPTQQGNTYTWTVDLAAGQSVTLKITDSTGAINYSDKVTIQAGTSTTCGNSGAAAAGAGSSSAVAAVASASPSTASSRQPLTSASTPAATLNSATSAAPANSKSSATSAASGIGAAAVGSSTAPSSTSKANGAATLKAATGLLVGGLVFALAA